MTPTPTAARVSGTIKALEWTDGATYCGQPMSYAETEFGLWMVVAYTGRDGRWTPCDPCGNDSDDDWLTPVEAKASVEAEHNARILAAIQPDPEPVVPSSVRYRLKWLAGARPPTHPEPMEGSAAFETAEDALAFFNRQADDAMLQSLTRVETITTRVDPADPLTVATRSNLERVATPSSAGMVSVEAAAKVVLAEIERQFAAVGVKPVNMASEKALQWLRALAGEAGR